MDELHNELKSLIIDALALEDITPDDIDVEAPLFGDGLGLDSIDALELGIALQKTYGVKVDASAKETRDHFASVQNLALFVQGARQK
jgi:acyl carrier protein